MRALRKTLIAAAASALIATPVAASAATRSVLDLELNESRGATVAADGSGLGHNGAIGSMVTMNGSYARFGYHDPNVSLGSAPLILVQDASDGSLDPGTGKFTAEMKLRTTYGENILQKGQATTSGGQFKMELQGGKFTCGVKTSGGNAVVNSNGTVVQDGLWHVIKCVRTTSSLEMFIDGNRTGHSTKTTGNLNNTYPWSLGGKPHCSSNVSCDYFAGDVDYVRLTKG